ncbi:F-box only protein 5 [Cololabis saira]|uniref:F-box only protein 5 n=1 Tax=Cololabis saira TaxID=129043 RepID=UPI002AD28228|nr:F-box only protein 5 [Cololabis saira]
MLQADGRVICTAAQRVKGGKRVVLGHLDCRPEESTYSSVRMFHCERVTMKHPYHEARRDGTMEKSFAAESKLLQLKASPVKEPNPIKAPSPEVTNTLFAIKNLVSAVHNKENSTTTEHEQTQDECFEDSGYLSLHNSRIECHHEEEGLVQEKPAAGLSAAAAHPEKTAVSKDSPTKCQGRTKPSHQASLAVSTPVGRSVRRTLSSTPSDRHTDHNLPILRFEQVVCEELAKNYKKNKRYDWSIISKVAENHLLDRVIGGHMGLEYVDMFTSLLSRNMRSILTNILALLGEMDLISCKKVSRTWRKIICEDTAAMRRCQQAETALRESRSSLRQKASGLTRDVTMSRVVLSCMQTLASSSAPSSSSSLSTPSSKSNRRTPSVQDSTPKNQSTRFNQFTQAASRLKNHESQRCCRRCGSPATHLSEVQRATCTRSSCLFDFCTRCQEPFHGSTPCRMVQPKSQFSTSKTNPILPGSARSKRSIRRL